MAPRKRTSEDQETAKQLKTEMTTSTRVTRSMSHRPSRNVTKQASSGAPALAGRASRLEQPKKKKAKVEKPIKKIEDGKEEDSKWENKTDMALVDDSTKRTIVIEHCKQCNSFKTRAMAVKKGLEEGVPGGVNVILNPEKPRRGCFEIREQGGVTFVSLLDMKRPFSPMKALDMDQEVAKIIKKMK